MSEYAGKQFVGLDPRTTCGMSVGFARHTAGRVLSVEFTYRLTGTGWSEGRLVDGPSSVTFEASYLGDALGVLLEAIGSLLEGAEQARCSWVQEPGESRWIFDRVGEEARLRLLTFADAERPELDDRGEVVFDRTAPLREMAGAIASGAQKVLDEYGEDEYLRLWVEHRFPVGQLKLIQSRLEAE